MKTKLLTADRVDKYVFYFWNGLKWKRTYIRKEMDMEPADKVGSSYKKLNHVSIKLKRWTDQ